jgi:starvation-inducible DNA-binding protein
MINQIGLDKDKSKKLADDLNDLLANYQLFYINTRGFHWNIKGDKFFELHAKFEELYTDLQLKIDEVAERILTLGFQPLHSFTSYLEKSEIKPAINISGGKDAVAEILVSFKIILEKQRLVLVESDEMNDEGTNALMSDYISEQEKLVWMYSSFLA